MAGVPSSRGCEYCRRQKQKCDEEKPQCGRCKRLKIACIGAGKKQYMFKSQPSKYNTKPQSRSPVHNLVAMQVQGSKVDKIANKLVQDLRVADPRYSLWVYGLFLVEVPKQLGSNDALDAAVDSFSTALPVLHTKVVSEDMQAKYIEALAALRTTLSHSDLATSSGTLCAIFFLTITQLYLGIRGGQETSHSKGVLQIIRYASMHKARSEFDLNLLKCLSLGVVFDSLFNSAIQLDSYFYQLIESWEIRKFSIDMQDNAAIQHDQMSKPVNSLVLRNLAKLPPVVHRPSYHIIELKYSYQQIQSDLALVRQRIKIAAELFKRRGADELSPELKCLVLHQTMYSMLLGISLFLNSILLALGESPSVLADESAYLCQDVLELAMNCYRYRPLGASHMPLTLMVACAASNDMEYRLRLGSLLEDWQDDFPATGYVQGMAWLRTRLQDIQDGRE